MRCMQMRSRKVVATARSGCDPRSKVKPVPEEAAASDERKGIEAVVREALDVVLCEQGGALFEFFK